jgi:ABC-type sugar transport system substrate-binding protein
MHHLMRASRRTLLATAFAALAVGLPPAANAQQVEIKVGYMKNPIQDASLNMMEKWAKANARTRQASFLRDSASSQICA